MTDKSRQWLGILTMVLAGFLIGMGKDIIGAAFFIVGGMYFTSMTNK
jgi:hypothetical protein